MKSIEQLAKRARDVIEAGDPLLEERFKGEMGMDSAAFINAVERGKLYVVGEWGHYFGPGEAEKRVRLQVDALEGKLLAAQLWTGYRFEDIWGERLRDLEESVIEGNALHLVPAEYGLEYTSSLAPWAVHSMQTINSYDGQAALPKALASVKSLELTISLPGNFGDGWTYRLVRPMADYYKNFAMDCLEAVEGYKACDLDDMFGERWVKLEVADPSQVASALAAIERLSQVFDRKLAGEVLAVSHALDVSTDGITFTVHPADEGLPGVNPDVPLLKDVPSQTFLERHVAPEYALIRRYSNPSVFLSHCQAMDSAQPAQDKAAQKEEALAPGL